MGAAGVPTCLAAQCCCSRHKLRPPTVLQELIESIGQEKARVDEEVEKGREDEEAAAALQKEVTAFQEECATDLAAAEPVIKVCTEVQPPPRGTCV